MTAIHLQDKSSTSFEVIYRKVHKNSQNEVRVTDCCLNSGVRHEGPAS